MSMHSTDSLYNYPSAQGFYSKPQSQRGVLNLHCGLFSGFGAIFLIYAEIPEYNQILQPWPDQT